MKTNKQPPPLWEHQKDALRFALNRGACGLFMGMRTGKTRVAVEVINKLRPRNVLVVTLASIVEDGVWEDELSLCTTIADLHVERIDGTVKRKLQRLDEIDASAHGVAIISYESSWRAKVGKKIKQIQWDLVILDEGHKIKAAGSKVSLFFWRLGLKVPRRMDLTGTPMSNSPLDVYGQYRFLDPSVYGTRYNDFEARYAIVNPRNIHHIVGYRNIDELERKMQEHAFIVKTEDVIDMPETLDTVTRIDLDRKSRNIYDELEKEALVEIERALENGETLQSVASVANVLTKMTRLQQITSGFIKDDAGEEIEISYSKQRALADILSSMATKINPETGEVRREPVVVCTRFKRDAANVKKVAREVGYTVSELTGSANQLKHWKAGETDLLVVQIQSGNAGLDLSRACFVILYSVENNLGIYQQFRYRFLGSKQTRSVRYIHLHVRDSIDEDIDAALNGKHQLIESILKRVKERNTNV